MDYRKEIDGLRALAVLPVILFHAGFQAFSGGYVGVDVFFVISGYLITTLILLEKEAGRFTIVDFYERRARRILPALCFVLLACLPFALLWLLPADLSRFFDSVMAVSVFSSNIYFWRTSGYFDVDADLNPLMHTWSLAVEEQYYVLFPVFLLLAWKLRKRWIVILLAVLAAISLAMAQWSVVKLPRAAFFLLPPRGWELLMGALVAVYSVNRNESEHGHDTDQFFSLLGLALILYAITGFDKDTPFPSLYTIIPTLGAVLIILFAGPQTLVGKLLGSRLFVGIGLVSYSAYLWHQPLFALARHRSLDEPGKPLMSVLAIAALGLAFLSWKFVEMPWRDKQRFSRKQVFIYAASCSAVFFMIGLAAHVNKAWLFTRDPYLFKIQSSNLQVLERNTKDCWNRMRVDPDIQSGCRIGADNAKPLFSIIGDSHAGTLVSSLDSAARRIGLPGVSYTFKSCPPLKTVNPVKFTRDEVPCVRLRDSFFRALEKNSGIPDTVIVSARWARLMEQTPFDNQEGGRERNINWIWNLAAIDSDYHEAMRRVFIDSINAILRSGRKVILVYPIPEAGWDVPSRMAKLYRINGSLTASDVSTSYPVYLERNRNAIDALDAVGEHGNLVRVRPDRILCDTYVKNRCVTQLNGIPLYFDNNHLSDFGASLVTEEIMARIDKPASRSLHLK